MLRIFVTTWIVSAAFLLTACQREATPASSPPGEKQSLAQTDYTYNVDLRWTSYGIPHVKADDWGSLGYGFAYAVATDALCVIARDVLMVRGELTRTFGATAENLISDTFHKAVITDAKLSAFAKQQSSRAATFARGYVAGYNRYLTDHADQLPASCAEQNWIKPLEDDDVTRLAVGVGIRYGLGRFQQAIANAAPGDNAQLAEVAWTLPPGIGSNAVAVGSALSASGRGILLGNPHYPWHGSSRFHLIHTTIPGELDVMGTSLLTTNRVAIGFNKDMAWTHTVSTAMRFTLYQLQLNPDNPTEYFYDGAYRAMERRVIDVAGANAPAVVYFSHYGPVLESAEMPWTSEHAFTIRDAVIDNYLTADTYDAINKAGSTAELEAALEGQGVYWTNTIAADRAGHAFYADISGTPNVDADLLTQCQIEGTEVDARVVVLDGARKECAWRDDERSLVPGALPSQDMPRLTRLDYVTNSNDSYWLSNPAAPLEGYSPIIGAERTARSLRTRAGLHFMAELIASGEKVTSGHLQDMLYSHRNFGAELLLDDVLGLCGENKLPDEPCAVLANWDRTMQVDSVGGHLWREFWDTARSIEGLYAIPFDASDPVQTPRGINPAVTEGLNTALVEAVARLESAGIALDARLGDIQYANRGKRKIPIPGGEGWAGMFSMIVTRLEADRGYSPIIHGNSYIQVIGWNKAGEIQPQAMLTYSQSPEPDSAHYSDLTELYAQGQWITLPFTETEIAADPNLVHLTLVE